MTTQPDGWNSSGCKDGGEAPAGLADGGGGEADVPPVVFAAGPVMLDPA
jgi:hypothetical protein